MSTIGDQQLLVISKRKGVPIPAANTRVHLRGLYQFYELLERFGSRDPSNAEIIDWFKTNKGSLPTHPDGRQVWLDLCRLLGHEPRPYEQIATNNPLKLQIEHWFCQHLAGDRLIFINGIVGRLMAEQAFNNSPEFKCAGSPAKDAFFGHEAAAFQRQFVSWANTGENYKLPSICFLQSTFASRFDMLTTPIYLSSGLRSTNRTRQLSVSSFFAPEVVRAAPKRARIEEVFEQSSDPVSRTTLEDELVAKLAASEARIADLDGQLEVSNARVTKLNAVEEELERIKKRLPGIEQVDKRTHVNSICDSLADQRDDISAQFEPAIKSHQNQQIISENYTAELRECKRKLTNAENVSSVWNNAAPPLLRIMGLRQESKIPWIRSGADLRAEIYFQIPLQTEMSLNAMVRCPEYQTKFRLQDLRVLVRVVDGSTKAASIPIPPPTPVNSDMTGFLRLATPNMCTCETGTNEIACNAIELYNVKTMPRAFLVEGQSIKLIVTLYEPENDNGGYNCTVLSEPFDITSRRPRTSVQTTQSTQPPHTSAKWMPIRVFA